jgi:hypothetical protein
LRTLERKTLESQTAKLHDLSTLMSTLEGHKRRLLALVPAS